MELSKRLQAVVNLVSEGCRVADIGCDHGYISIYLVQNHIVPHCIAMDVNEGPLKRAREHIEKERLSTYIETRLSDGAKELKMINGEDREPVPEADAAVIAGMGGRLMIRILSESMDKFQGMKELILQPQSEIAAVRRFLRENGFRIEKEDMVLEDGKYYSMMKAVPGQMREADNHTELFDLYGEWLLKNKHACLHQFLQKETAMFRQLLERLTEQQEPSEKIRLRKEEVRQTLKNLEQGLEWYKSEMQ